MAGSLAVASGAAWPAASSATAHRRGPLPAPPLPRTAASPATRRNAPPGDRACTRGRAVLLAPGILKPRKDHNQGRTSSLRSGRSTLILIFHGKTRHLSGGRTKLHSASIARRCAITAVQHESRRQV